MFSGVTISANLLRKGLAGRNRNRCTSKTRKPAPSAGFQVCLVRFGINNYWSTTTFAPTLTRS